jgi:hypothetical protein
MPGGDTRRTILVALGAGVGVALAKVVARRAHCFSGHGGRSGPLTGRYGQLVRSIEADLARQSPLIYRVDVVPYGETGSAPE